MSSAAENPFRIVQSSSATDWDPAPRIASLLIKPASALCNLDCDYCFYLDREADPYEAIRTRIMAQETLQRLVDGYLAYSFPNSTFRCCWSSAGNISR